MGNKPELRPVIDIEPSSLTERLISNPRIAYFPSPVDRACMVLFAFAFDQLLIGKEVLDRPKIKKLLAKFADPTGTSVFDGLQGLAEDVEIWRLKDVSGKKPWPDVAEFISWFRTDVLAGAGIAPEKVAPNHILVPSPNYHDCPWGPPTPHPALATINLGAPKVTVGVIDAGWLATGPAMGLVRSASYGDWLDAGHYKWKTSSAAGRMSAAGPAGKPRLRALTAHANFVVGEIARVCDRAGIVVESHNAAYVERDKGDPAIPTEASVARSIWRLATTESAEVINVGFAFPTMPTIPLALMDLVTPGGPPSWTLQVVLDSLAAKGTPPFIVAPAGNQGCSIPQFPAALAGPKYPNVIGVGSVDDAAKKERSDFSNHGDWVKCGAVGKDVASTFITTINIETEESDDPARPDDANALHSPKKFNGWATWSGTSFAAPKVAGLLANGRADGNTLAKAWADLAATGTPVSGLGVVFGV